MKKIARLLLTLSLVFCVLLALPLNASAASSATQDGLEVTITNDKTEYTADEDIQVSVNIKTTILIRLKMFLLKLCSPKVWC